MLTQLTINNFAIVHQLNIELLQGMSVITGETGAGKSIAIDALGVCLGQRTEASMLREGQERADICATFHLNSNNPAFQFLQENELQDPDNPEDCILRRIINHDGRSKAFINGIPVSAAQLKEIGQHLIQINGQHASQRLLKNDYQLQLVDNFCQHTALLQQMSLDYQTWRNLQHQVKTFQQKCAENEARKQLLQYQVSELDEFNLKENEYEELEADHLRLSNSEELTQLSQSVLQLLSENETVSADSLLYRAVQHLSELYELADIEQRMGQTVQLARKHNVKPQDLVALHRRLKAELNELEDFSGSEEMLIQQEQAAHEKMLATATALHQSRQLGAQKLAQQVTKSIKQLAMEHAEFVIELHSDYDKISSNGADSAIFTLQSNLGQSAQPLAKIASGGELSRIALAIQVQASNQTAIPTLIFDEIDVGISGATANVVGKLLRKLSEKCQVICVTHLPQVACHGTHHFSVEKSTVDQKTETKMTALSPQQRVKALAKLLGGSKITDAVLANAQEMLDAAA